MTIIILLIVISLSMAIVFLGIFYWSMKSGQYDDTYTPSVRMLFEDKKTEAGNKKNNSGVSLSNTNTEEDDQAPKP